MTSAPAGTVQSSGSASQPSGSATDAGGSLAAARPVRRGRERDVAVEPVEQRVEFVAAS